MLLDNVTLAPAAGATPFNVTVPVAVFPAVTEVGLKTKEESVGTLTVSVALWIVPNVPVIVTGVLVATAKVVAVKLADVLPAVTVTVDGTEATVVLLLWRATIAPPVGAAPLRVTVPVELLPPPTEAGFNVSVLSVAELTASVAPACVLPYVPEISTFVLVPTGMVVTVNVAVVLPAETVTLAATCAAEVLLLKRLTVTPPVGAAPLNVTVPVDCDVPLHARCCGLAY